ncbi:unnamed protein product [Mytilus coruscus]|uniref:Uncharacterized protein n=1 Tax=Mytilus coruscus TaxID=42192 RepID=A0A6J8C8D8_MYTCO|nr:unnamed protein product [Mytilus coruscus]
MAKRKAETLNDDEISGYLVEVSPIKTSQQNNKYFDGTINSNRKTFQHFVCFDVSKHCQFRSAGTQKSPVKLQRISQVPSKRDASQNDVLVKRTSSLNVLRSLDFSCKEQPKETSEQCTLEKIQNLPEKSKVNVVAAVMNKSNSEIVDVRGTLINKCTSIVADNTQQMELTLSKHHIDKVVVGKTYHFTNVSTSFFHTYTLTTTSSTYINDHYDLLDIADYQEESTSTTITGAITQIILHKSAQCGNCHKSIKDIPTGNVVR